MFNLKTVALLIALLVAGVYAANVENTLRQRISQKLEMNLEAQVRGIQNCANKCSNSFSRMAYMISTTGQPTYEFTACIMGCNHCQGNLNGTYSSNPSDCFDYCKNYDWKAEGLLKGIIEPDKACMGGCVINTCQSVCLGGTTDPTETPQNQVSC